MQHSLSFGSALGALNASGRRRSARVNCAQRAPVLASVGAPKEGTSAENADAGKNDAAPVGAQLYSGPFVDGLSVLWLS